MEKQLIDLIEKGIRQIKKGTAPKDTKAGYALNKLKPINPYMYEDLMEKYKEALAEYKKNQAK